MGVPAVSKDVPALERQLESQWHRNAATSASRQRLPHGCVCVQREHVPRSLQMIFYMIVLVPLVDPAARHAVTSRQRSQRSRQQSVE